MGIKFGSALAEHPSQDSDYEISTILLRDCNGVCRQPTDWIIPSVVRVDGSRIMQTFLGLLFLYFSFSYLRDAMNPNRLTRLTVQLQCIVLCIMSAIVGLSVLFAGSIGVQ